MNKQELIDKAVERFSGKWPSSNWLESESNKHCLILLKRPLLDLDDDDIAENEDNYTGAIIAGGTAFNPDYCEFICLKHEYLERARELGWCNGYKYGVEYETNGKKPDLPKDVKFKVTGKMIGGNAYQNEFVVDECDWNDAITFCITDKRYKPAEQKSTGEPSFDGGIGGGGGGGGGSWCVITQKIGDGKAPDWYDYDKQQAIALPPVGVDVEILSEGYDIKQYHVVWSGDGLIFGYDNNAPFIYGHFSEATHGFRPLDWNRKAEAEKREFIDKACLILAKNPTLMPSELLGMLYDADCRFIDKKGK